MAKEKRKEPTCFRATMRSHFKVTRRHFGQGQRTFDARTAPLLPFLPKGEVYFNQTNAGCCPSAGCNNGENRSMACTSSRSLMGRWLKMGREWVDKFNTPFFKIFNPVRNNFSSALDLIKCRFFSTRWQSRRWFISYSSRDPLCLPLSDTHPPLIRVKVWFDPWTRLAVCDWVSLGRKAGGRSPGDLVLFLVATLLKCPPITDIHTSRKWTPPRTHAVWGYTSAPTTMPLWSRHWCTLCDLIVPPQSCYPPRCSQKQSHMGKMELCLVTDDAFAGLGLSGVVMV